MISLCFVVNNVMIYGRLPTLHQRFYFSNGIFVKVMVAANCRPQLNTTTLHIELLVQIGNTNPPGVAFHNFL
jgi:hypothetical protein